MKLIFLIIICLFITVFSFSQEKIININSFEELIEFQSKMVNVEEVVMVWGKYGGWGKYWGYDSEFCKSVLDSVEYSRINSVLSFKLFNSEYFTHQPKKFFDSISNPITTRTLYKEGDLIKCKIRLYKRCKSSFNEIFFLVEEIY